jgi:hypothetical protein
MVSVSLATGLLLFRHLLRNRIQPNQDFPMSPQLPAGSPPALLVDESSGELRSAVPDQSRASDTNGWLDFQIGRHELPTVCCGCLQESSAAHSYKCPVNGVIELEIPRCADCTRESNREFRRIWFILAALGLLAGSASILPQNLGAFEFWVFSGATLLLACAFASFIASTKTVPVKVSRGDSARGVVKLRFRNANYGLMVAKQMQGSGSDI